MPTNLHPLEQAVSVLQSSSATPKDKLALGSKLLWGATVFSKDWTPELLDRARTAYKSLTDHNTVERTLRQMDEKAISRLLKQFTKDVTQLATDIEQARSQQTRPRKS